MPSGKFYEGDISPVCLNFMATNNYGGGASGMPPNVRLFRSILRNFFDSAV